LLQDQTQEDDHCIFVLSLYPPWEEERGYNNNSPGENDKNNNNNNSDNKPASATHSGHPFLCGNLNHEPASANDCRCNNN
jgi:hypothetical protein